MDSLIDGLVKLRNNLEGDYSALCDEAIRKLEYYRGYEDGSRNRKKAPQTRRKLVATVDNSVSDFLKTFQNIDGQISRVVYLAYVDYCEKMKFNPLSHIEFSRQVCRILHTITIPKRFSKDAVARIFLKGG